MIIKGIISTAAASITAVLGFLGLTALVVTAIIVSPAKENAATATAADCASVSTLTPMHVTGAKAIPGYSKKQMEYAAIITKTAEDEDMGTPGKIMALMATIQESTLGTGRGWNKPNGDHDAGFFQQRILPGWYGSLAMVNDPAYGTRAFLKGVTAKKPGDWGTVGGGGHLPGLIDYKKSWGNTPASYGAAIQKVQVSAFPHAYTKHYGDAKRIIEGLSGVTVTGGDDPCKPEDPSSAVPEGEAKKGGVQLQNVFQYYQSDKPWGSLPYGNSTVGVGGCGPTTVASIITSFYPDRPLTPKASKTYFEQNGGRADGAGSYHIWQTSKKMQKKYQFSAQHVTPNAANARRGIQEGGLVMISVRSSTEFTGGGHIMMIRGIRGDKFLVGTSSGYGKPGSRNQNNREFPASAFKFGSGTWSMDIIKPTGKTNFKRNAQ